MTLCLLKVGRSATQQGGSILEFTDPQVAIMADHSTDFSGCMVVVHHKRFLRSFSSFSSAYRATAKLGFQKGVEFIKGHSVMASDAFGSLLSQNPGSMEGIKPSFSLNGAVTRLAYGLNSWAYATDFSIWWKNVKEGNGFHDSTSPAKLFRWDYNRLTHFGLLIGRGVQSRLAVSAA